MTEEKSGVMLVEELAEAAGVSGVNIRQLLRRGVLKGHKRGGIWIIPQNEAERYLERREGRQRARFLKRRTES